MNPNTLRSVAFGGLIALAFAIIAYRRHITSIEAEAVAAAKDDILQGAAAAAAAPDTTLAAASDPGPAAA